MTLRIAIVGLGKIAHDQHLGAIDASPDFELVAGASHAGDLADVPVYRSIEDLLAADHKLDAIAMCQPPQARFDAAQRALEAGHHVLLEKPPGATLSEIGTLISMADTRKLTLFAAWHSRAAEGVQPARNWLAQARIRSVTINWKEDVRRWHPGQQWIWQAGGLGVFDPGINALSIVTHVLPSPFFLTEGLLEVPENCQAPIAATLKFQTVDGAPIHASFDFRQEGPQIWEIVVETDKGILTLADGGSRLIIDGANQPLPPEREYGAIYDRFARLIREGRSDVDRAPFRHVADAYMRSNRKIVSPFHE